MMIFSGIADEAGSTIEQQIKAHQELGWKYIELRMIDGENKMKEMNQWLKNVRNRVKLKQWWPVLESKLIGHYRYYGISGNMPAMQTFYSRSLRLAHRWINRRSQKTCAL